MPTPRDSRPLTGLEWRVLQGRGRAAPAAGSTSAAAGSTVPAAAAADFAVGLVADLQRGVVTRSQLLACGLTADGIRRRLARGWLRVMHRGVYAVGHTALAPLARETAAVLAYGEGALLSHLSAAALWGMRAVPPERGIDITVAGRNPGRKRGVRLHRVAELDRRDVRCREGIPVVSPARALLEIAPLRPARELERALDEGVLRGVVSPAEVSTTLQRYPRRPGSADLARLVESARTPALTRSEAERRLLSLVRRGGLPEPEVNGRVGDYEVDFVWRPERLIVEIDGFAFHRSRGAFEHDRRRDVWLTAAGFRVLRFTWRQLVEESEVILVRLGQAMPLSLRARAG